MNALLQDDPAALPTETLIAPGNWETFRQGSFSLETVAAKVKELLDQKHASTIYILENFCAAIQGYEERGKNITCASKIFSCFCCCKERGKKHIETFYKQERTDYLTSKNVELRALALVNVFSERATFQKSDHIFKDLALLLSKKPELSIKSQHDWQEQLTDLPRYMDAARTFRDLILFKKLDTRLSLFGKRVKQNLETLVDAANQKFPSDPALSDLITLAANTLGCIPDIKNSGRVSNLSPSKKSGLIASLNSKKFNSIEIRGYFCYYSRSAKDKSER